MTIYKQKQIIFKMLNKNYKEAKKEIKSLFDSGDHVRAKQLISSIILELYEEKQHELVTDLYKIYGLAYKDAFELFEVAYSLNNRGNEQDAKSIYEILLKRDPRNSAILNNLSNIKKHIGDINGAWELIQKAKEIEPDDEIINRNFNEISLKIGEIEEKEALFKSAVELVENENDFVIDKLSNFISGFRKESESKNGMLAIPSWKFKILMKTDEQKAKSLLDQWLKKGYLQKTGKRGDYNEHIYELNPYLEAAIRSRKPKNINPEWIEALASIDTKRLNESGYFEVLKKIEKTKKNRPPYIKA